MCEDVICEPGGERWMVNAEWRSGHGLLPYGPECVEVARGLALGWSPTMAVRVAFPDDEVIDLRKESAP